MTTTNIEIFTSPELEELLRRQSIVRQQVDHLLAHEALPAIERPSATDFLSPYGRAELQARATALETGGAWAAEHHGLYVLATRGTNGTSEVVGVLKSGESSPAAFQVHYSFAGKGAGDIHLSERMTGQLVDYAWAVGMQAVRVYNPTPTGVAVLRRIADRRKAGFDMRDCGTNGSRIAIASINI